MSHMASHGKRCQERVSPHCSYGHATQCDEALRDSESARTGLKLFKTVICYLFQTCDLFLFTFNFCQFFYLSKI